MISRLQLLRNVGVFDSVSGGANIDLARITLVHAENGRGKTTLAAILRSLATGDPIPIAERRRLAAQHPPYVVLDCTGGPPAAIFQNGAWNRSVPNMAVFDDLFIDRNVSSGLTVDPEHRQHLHELILGTSGVSLNHQLQQFVEQIEDHNTALRTKGAAIPAVDLGTLSVDEFCELPARDDIDAAIQTTGRNLAAAREQGSIRDTSPFDPLPLPNLDLGEINRVLQSDLPTLDHVAAARVKAHLARLGLGGEEWVADGMRRVTRASSGGSTADCPFCAQNLDRSSVLEHYRAYFSDAYEDLKRAVSDTLKAICRTHGGDVPAAFERAVRIAGERRQFWSSFCDVPEFGLDTAAIVGGWRAAREAVAASLEAKQAAPLESMTLSREARSAIATYETHCQIVACFNQGFENANQAIDLVKEQASTGNQASLTADLARLKAVKARHAPATAALCEEYLAEKTAKTETERQRDEARSTLDEYRTSVFPGYETAINMYLQGFTAGFRLDSVTSVNTRGGSTCNYNVIINDTPIPVSGSEPAPDEPAFRNTLSAGDRNTLALAFFFASLDQDPALPDKIVVIDDPISSLDEHRSLTTVQEIRHLAERVGQVIVLSHRKPFLCRIWEGADSTIRCALQVAREGNGSTISEWYVNEDCITEHDRRDFVLRDYLVGSGPTARDVAKSLRPHLEAFLRVANPEHFPPGTLLGPFLNLCEGRLGTSTEILNEGDTSELRNLNEYARRFHHETNQAWETETINDTELVGFVQRTLEFVRRPR